MKSMASQKRKAPSSPTAGVDSDSDSSSDESSLSSGDGSSDEDDSDVEDAPVPVTPGAAPAPSAKPKNAVPGSAPHTPVAPVVSAAAFAPRPAAPKIDLEKLTLTLLRNKWSKMSQDHRSAWFSPDGAEYKTTTAILDAYPELAETCAP